MRAGNLIVGRPLPSVPAVAATQGVLLLAPCEPARAAGVGAQPGRHKPQQRILISQLWGLEVQDRAVSRAASFWDPSSGLVVGHLHSVFSLCVSVS